MLVRLIALAAAATIIEVLILVRVGQAIGLWPTLGILAFFAVVGALVARYESVRVLGELRQHRATGRPPARGPLDHLLILAGALLFIVPGFLSDVAGLVLMVPAGRRAVLNLGLGWLQGLALARWRGRRQAPWRGTLGRV